jgi:homogentisate 1,2-dioxygenase
LIRGARRLVFIHSIAGSYALRNGWGKIFAPSTACRPDAATFEKASHAELSKPDVITDTMAFMFETRAVIRPTRQALDAAHRQRDYQACWAGLEKHFSA